MQVSIKLSRSPSPDEYGDWGLRSGAAHFEDGWFTYGIDTNDEDFFAQHVGDGWPKWIATELWPEKEQP